MAQVRRSAADALREALEVLRRAYPHGVPEDGYMALLTVPGGWLSEENLAIVVAELIDGEVAVVANDAAAAQLVRLPTPEVNGCGQHLTPWAGHRTLTYR